MWKQWQSSKSTVATESRASVYEEGMEMLVASVIIYIFAELRDMVREGKVADLNLEDLSPPLTTTKTLEIIQRHKGVLQERAVDHDYLESRLKALQQAYEGTTESGKSNNIILKYLYGGFSDGKPQAEQESILKRFDDNNSKEELVHAVVVNPRKHRITVVFRGSVTPKDFLQDAKCAQKKVDNPVLKIMTAGGASDTTTMSENIRVHSGFHEYLSHSRSKTPNETKTRLEEILDDIKFLLKEYPGYTLYMSGHSLGGALSTLCGFYAACDDEIIRLAANNRIVIYSFASPYCGNWKFRHAFQALENQRRLQHLRTANFEDMVTLLPFAVPKATFLSPALSMVQGAGNLYKHVGIKLQIKKDENGKISHTIVYPKELYCDDDQEYAKELQHAIDQGRSLVKAFYFLCTRDFQTVEKYHSCDEYEKRFEACQASFKGRTLDDLYQDTTIVGKLFSPDFQRTPLSTGGISRVIRAWSILSKNSKAGEQDLQQEDEEEMTLTEAALAK